MISLLRRLFAFLVLLLAPLAASSSAQQTAVVTAPAPAPSPAPTPATAATAETALRPALWKLADADTTIYLFGTIHALPRGMEWLEGPVATALDGSDELITEIPEVSTAQVQQVVLRRGVLGKGQSLRTGLSPKQRAAYEAALRRYGLPIDAFDRYKPWYAAVGLATLPLLRDGYAAQNGVETTLISRIKARGGRHGALETLDYQLSLFDELPPRSQRAFLHDVVTAMPTMRGELEQVIREWGQGRADALAALLNDDNEDPAILAALLTNRNRTWAGWVQRRMDQPGVVFIAVGAGHLAGPGSVQQLLEQQGRTITRVQ